MEKVKWGILGLGNIAHKFCQDLLLVHNAQLEAVASSSKKRAVEFSKKYGAKRAYGSYDELYDDPEVEVIYVASLHVDHVKHSIDAIRSGKAVLCEKPLAMNKREVNEMIIEATKHQVFLMEALWARFNPAVNHILDLIDMGEVGNVSYINASFNFNGLDMPADSRLFSREKGGGALLDVGIYPVFLAYFLLGKPDKIFATSELNDQNVDLQTAIIFDYQEAHAVLHCGFKCKEKISVKVCGDKGYIEIPEQWHKSKTVYTYKSDEDYFSDTHGSAGEGYTDEIEEVNECLLSGKIQSEKWSLQNSLDLISILDQIRKICGIIY